MARKTSAGTSVSDNRCRVCGREFLEQPLLRFENMPSIAQHLPDARALKRDRGVDLDVFMCSGCGLVQLNVEPVSYFKEDIRAAGFSEEMRDFRMKQFGGFIEKYALKGRKVLEIGAGRGEYLALMQELGARAFGLEYSEGLVQECVNNGLKAAKGFIEHERYEIAHSPFDAFFILSFLEHLPRPNNVLRGIWNNLASGAVGIVEVPSLDMILRCNLFSEFFRDHLFYFTRQSLGFVLQMNGFEVLSCEEVWHDYIISAVVRKRERPDLSNLFGLKEKIRKEIDGYVGRFQSVAIWGAGHQAFAMMSMMDLGGRIKYVVDSAPFKQGRFSPATHIPIVAPDALRSDPVEAVIIMAGSYSQEVKKLLRRDFDRKINAALLRDWGLELEA